MDYVVEVDFQSPVHVGEPGIGEEATTQILHSDTWFSAMTVAIRQLYGEVTVKRWMNELAPPEADPWTQELSSLAGNAEENPPFRISSAFPMLKRGDSADAEEPLYFLPKPMLPPPGFDRADGADGGTQIREKWAKEVKKIRFVPVSLWKKWISAEKFSDEDYESLKLFRIKELAHVGSETLLPRVSLDRETSASEYFRQGLRVYGKGAGVFFFLQVSPEWQPTVAGALRWLGENGIGGKRSVGYGRFSSRWRPFFGPSGQGVSAQKVSDQAETFKTTRGLKALEQLFHPSFQENGYVTLSLYHPTMAERGRDWRNASVQWLDRRGWSAYGDDGLQVKRRSVRMLSEGSLFPWRPLGHLVDVTPDIWRQERTVYRNGLALAIPVLREARGEAIT